MSNIPGRSVGDRLLMCGPLILVTHVYVVSQASGFCRVGHFLQNSYLHVCITQEVKGKQVWGKRLFLSRSGLCPPLLPGCTVYATSTILSTWSAASSAPALTDVDVSDRHLLEQGVELAQLRVARLVPQHLHLLRCLVERFLMGCQKERREVTAPSSQRAPGRRKHALPAKLTRTHSEPQTHLANHCNSCRVFKKKT